MKCLFIDHEDSFTHNVINYLKTKPFPLDVDCLHFKKIQYSKVSDYDLIVLGPGPFSPRKVTESIELVKDHIHHIPILGICLGMQIMNVATGGDVTRSSASHHGSVKKILWNSSEIDWGSSKVGSYNSLTNINISKEWTIIAKDSNGESQGMISSSGSVCSIGVQFHPESFLSKDSSKLKIWMMKKLINEM